MIQLFVTTTYQCKAGLKQAKPERLFNGVALHEIQGEKGLEFLIQPTWANTVMKLRFK